MCEPTVSSYSGSVSHHLALWTAVYLASEKRSSFYYLSFLSCFVCFFFFDPLRVFLLSFPFFVLVYILYHGYVPGAIRLQGIRDGIPQLDSTVSLTDSYITAVHAISCTGLFSPIDIHFS